MPSVSAASSLKVVEDPLVPRNTDFAHSVRLHNYTRDRFGQTQFIDVLPYNGDGRGTKCSGDYWLEDFPQFNGADRDKLRILYTTDDPRTVSQCPTNANAADRDQCAVRTPRCTRSRSHDGHELGGTDA